MTLSNRNAVFKAGMLISSVFFIMGVVVSPQVLPVYAGMDELAELRPEGFFSGFLAGFGDANLQAVHFAVLALSLFSLVAVSSIYFFFEKTQSPEILFVAFFALSFAPESLRLVLPLGQVHELPSLYSISAFRTVMFGRYFGLFSLFAASVYAASQQMQQQQLNAIMLILAASLFAALGLPMDSQVWDSSLSLLNGQSAMATILEAGISVITLASFFIAACQRNSGEFIFVGAGAVLAVLGRMAAIRSDTWLALLPAVVLLAVGTWLICNRLHKVYLWL